MVCAVDAGVAVVTKSIAELYERFKYFMDFGEASGLDFHTAWNLPCCQSCAVGELRELYEDEFFDGDYAFCHEQDVNSIHDTGRCHLAYGSFRPGVSAAEVGKRVAALLRRNGFVVEWDEQESRRICVRLDMHPVVNTEACRG